jgi:serine/threonine-protein kinase
MWVGRTLSKVRIERQIGRGGMAEVFLGLHTTLNRPVAVKILQEHFSEDDALQRRFSSEAQAVAALRHPNIVQVFDFDIVDGRPYIVMELLEGMALSDYLAGIYKMGHILPFETVSHLMTAIGSALDYAHERQIVHRDIKPANVMLRKGSTPITPGLPLPSDTEPVLTDFGVARIASQTTRTATGTILGTPAYMSPEQVLGEPVDARSDIYSLGVMGYELLGGRPPFTADTDTPASVLYKHVHVPPPPLPNTTPAVQAVVAKALAKDRNGRYQRAGAFAGDLRTALGVPGPAPAIPTARPPTSASVPAVPARPPAHAPSRRKGRPWALVAGAGLGIAGLVCVGLLGWAALGGALGGGTPPTGAAPPTEPVAALDATLPAETPATTSPPAFVLAPATGAAVFRDAVLQAKLSGLTPPQLGFVYEIWLVGPQASPVSLQRVDPAATEVTLQYSDPSGANLLTLYSTLMITIEPEPDGDPAASGTIAYQAVLEPELAELIALLREESPEGVLSSTVVQGLGAQVVPYDSHLGFAVSAAGGGDLSGAKSHCEHVINIVEGVGSKDFGDWNNNQRAENPGDDFGLEPYLRLFSALLAGVAASDDVTPETRDLASRLALDSGNLVEVASQASSLAQRISTADTAAEAAPLIGQLNALRLQATVESLLGQAQALPLSIVLEFETLSP